MGYGPFQAQAAAIFDLLSDLDSSWANTMLAMTRVLFLVVNNAV
jgi:hypothetical protein